MSGPYAPLHVEIRGQPAGPHVETFLLIHGFGASIHSWRYWVPYLEARGRVILIDMKGFGASDKPRDTAYGPVDQADLVGRLIEGEDPRSLTLVGHSLGGGVALVTAGRLAASGDARLQRLILIASPAYKQRLPPFVTFARYPRLTHLGLRVIGARRVVDHVLRSIVYDRSTMTADQIEAYAAPLRTTAGVRGTLTAARTIVPERLDELARRYSEIAVPALLIWGRHDRVIPLDIGHRLAKALPNARLEIMDACGHIPHEERPAESLDLVRTFLDGTSAA